MVKGIQNIPRLPIILRMSLLSTIAKKQNTIYKKIVKCCPSNFETKQDVEKIPADLNFMKSNTSVV